MPDSFLLNESSHRRYNPLRGSHVLVSPHRNKRPWQGLEESPSEKVDPAYDKECYLCPGNKRAQGQLNPKYEGTFVFVNDYSAVNEHQPHYAPETSDPLFQVEPVTGLCYVICFSPAHNVTLADMRQEEIEAVINTWTDLYIAHLNPESPLAKVVPAETISSLGDDYSKPSAQYRYMQIFENKGTTMGCSNPHPHGQVWTTSSLPDEPAIELQNLHGYHEEHKEHMLVSYVKKELLDKERVIFQNDTFVVLCPFWAVWPYEAMIVSKAHKRALVDFDGKERRDLAEAISDLTRRFENVFQTNFPYSMGLHQAPLDGTLEEIEASHFHMHFYPPLLRSATVRKFQVGYEMLGEPQRDITPEQAAERLRECGGPLYRTQN